MYRQEDFKQSLGQGAEKEVYAKDEKLVIAFHHSLFVPIRDKQGKLIQDFKFSRDWRDLSKAERIEFRASFYLIKLLNILYPDVIPGIEEIMHSKDVGITVRQRIFGSPLDLSKERSEIDEEHIILIGKAKLKMLLHGLLIDDKKGENFMRDSRGNVYYLDSFERFLNLKVFAALMMGRIKLSLLPSSKKKEAKDALKSYYMFSKLSEREAKPKDGGN
jgi:hypothetical protein